MLNHFQCAYNKNRFLLFSPLQILSLVFIQSSSIATDPTLQLVKIYIYYENSIKQSI